MRHLWHPKQKNEENHPMAAFFPNSAKSNILFFPDRPVFIKRVMLHSDHGQGL